MSIYELLNSKKILEIEYIKNEVVTPPKEEEPIEPTPNPNTEEQPKEEENKDQNESLFFIYHLQHINNYLL